MTEATENDKATRTLCDGMIIRCGEVLVEELGVDEVVMLHRMMTYAIARVAIISSKEAAIRILETFAETVEDGGFDAIIGDAEGRIH